MDDSKTVWCGNLDEEVTEELLYELFLQVAPLQRVKIPTDREGRKSNFGFVTFKHEVSVLYAVQLLNGIKLFQKNLNIKPRQGFVQQNIQRSVSYPNDAYLSPNTHNQHFRFNGTDDTGPQHVSYEDLMRLGPTMNVNYDNQESHYGNSHSNNRQRWERNSYKDRREHQRPRNSYERRNEHDRERERRNDHLDNNKNNRRNHHKRNHNFDRNGGKKHKKNF